MTRDEFMILWCIIVAVVILFLVGAGLVTRSRAERAKKEKADVPKTPESVQRQLEQEKRDAHRATWARYDRELDAQREALEAKPAPQPFMISLSTQDYLWYVSVAQVHMPWRYANIGTRHLEDAPETPVLEWGWRKVGAGQMNRSGAEVILSRIINTDENYYLYDADGLALGVVAKPAHEDDDDA